jgi:CBS-domain-containing membrane protein
MVATEKPFLALTAQDVMTSNVQVIPQGMSLRAAAHLLSQSRISGAPVVDDQGRCVGVLSASDFVHWAERGGEAERVHCTSFTCVCSDWQVVDVEFLPRDEVRWHMTAEPIMASPATRITDLARKMLDAHVHRIIVVDGERHPVGIVSGTDIMAAVAFMEQAWTAEEGRQAWLRTNLAGTSGS